MYTTPGVYDRTVSTDVFETKPRQYLSYASRYSTLVNNSRWNCQRGICIASFSQKIRYKEVRLVCGSRGLSVGSAGQARARDESATCYLVHTSTRAHALTNWRFCL